MGVGAGLYMYVVVVQKFTFANSSPDEFLSTVTIVFSKLSLYTVFQERADMWTIKNPRINLFVTDTWKPATEICKTMFLLVQSFHQLFY